MLIRAIHAQENHVEMSASYCDWGATSRWTVKRKKGEKKQKKKNLSKSCICALYWGNTCGWHSRYNP